MNDGDPPGTCITASVRPWVGRTAALLTVLALANVALAVSLWRVA